ncbi:MAG: hypothetical protein BWK80_08560 [Desulfobacteraceae bacterium IS3]|nr:MAG: hypothetical protein BWK80_08560 [Desulfobacteraceae bacterium IS3]
MFRKFGNAAMVPAMFLLSFYLLGTTGWAQGQCLLGTPPQGVFRIGGTVTTIGGELIHDDNDDGYTFVVTGEDGKPFISANGDKSEDTDGLNEHHYYVIDIPIYDPLNQPYGKKTNETARLHVYENGLELSFRSTPDTYGFTTVEGGTAKENPIIVSPVLYVTPPLYVVTKEQGKVRIDVMKAGSDPVDWTLEKKDSWTDAIVEADNSISDDDGEIIVSYGINTGEKRKMEIEVSGNLASDTRSNVSVEPRTVQIIQTGNTAGDMNQDGILNIKDVVLVCQILTGTGSGSLLTYLNGSLLADVNGDNRIGLEEAIYILEYLSGKRG